jgi:peptidoglycan biosynthesis protein MviN/MurJ (putative lipid II flippase)
VPIAFFGAALAMPGLGVLTPKETYEAIQWPILILLGLSGVVVGVLNSYDRFGVFAIAPFFWNLAIIAVLVGLAPAFPEDDRIYAYAIGVLVGTSLQLAMVAWDLRNTPFRFRRVFEWRGDLVKRVLILMLPVTISLGLINFNLLVNTFFATLIPGTIAETGEQVSIFAPAAIDKAFRIYMLPQGMFSVAVATVVFPTCRGPRSATAGTSSRRAISSAAILRSIILVFMDYNSTNTRIKVDQPSASRLVRRSRRPRQRGSLR